MIDTIHFQGPLYLVGEPVVMKMNCSGCGKSVISLRARLIGFCDECLKTANIQIGTLLVVEKPTTASRWN